MTYILLLAFSVLYKKADNTLEIYARDCDWVWYYMIKCDMLRLVYIIRLNRYIRYMKYNIF